MSYIVMEIQQPTSGDAATIVTSHPTRAEAESKYHTVLAAAAVSAVPCHSAILLTSRGEYVAAQSYEHGIEETEEA